MMIILGVGLYRFLIKSYGYIQTFKLTDYLTILAAFVGVLNLSIGTQAFSRVIFGLVAESFKALLVRKISGNQKMPGSLTGMGNRF